MTCWGWGGRQRRHIWLVILPHVSGWRDSPSHPTCIPPGTVPSHPGLLDCFRARQRTTIPAPQICCSPFPSVTTGQASSPALVPELSRLPDTCICIWNPIFHTRLLPRPAFLQTPNLGKQRITLINISQMLHCAFFPCIKHDTKDSLKKRKMPFLCVVYSRPPLI